MIGVCPAGAQVRWRVGMSQKPRSSRKARWAPRRWAFLYRRPRVALPMGDGLLVALDRLALGDLTAPAQAVQDLPAVRGVIAHPKLHPNHRRDAGQCPELVGNT